MRIVAALVALALCAAARASAEGLVGEIVPRDFQPLVAPENTLRLPHWGSSSNSTQIIEVAAEDSVVKAGDVVATFKFDAEEALEYLEQRLMQFEAEKGEEVLDQSRKVDQMRQEVTEGRIQLERTGLDLLKKNSLSRIKQTLLDFDVALLAKELESRRLKLASAEAKLAWTRSYHDRRIEAWKIHLRVFERTRDRYRVRSPVAGRVHYPTMESKNRKVRAGDDMNSGVHFLSIITSDRAGLEFTIPETSRSTVKLGSRVRVTGESIREATVRDVDLFPIHVGDARRNFLLPEAWERCFVVRATLAEGFSSFPSKAVRVEVVP